MQRTACVLGDWLVPGVARPQPVLQSELSGAFEYADMTRIELVGGRSDSLKLREPADVRQAECHAAHGLNQDCAHRIAAESTRPRLNRDNQRERDLTTFTSPANAPQTLPAYPITRAPP